MTETDTTLCCHRSNLISQFNFLLLAADIQILDSRHQQQKRLGSWLASCID